MNKVSLHRGTVISRPLVAIALVASVALLVGLQSNAQAASKTSTICSTPKTIGNGVKTGTLSGCAQVSWSWRGGKLTGSTVRDTWGQRTALGGSYAYKGTRCRVTKRSKGYWEWECRTEWLLGAEVKGIRLGYTVVTWNDFSPLAGGTLFQDNKPH